MIIPLAGQNGEIVPAFVIPAFLSVPFWGHWLDLFKLVF